MSHDFAKGPKKKTKRPPATPKPKAKKAQPKGERPPILLGLLAIGLSIALIFGLITLSKLAPRDNDQHAPKPQEETKFEFFTLLPENEITIDTPSPSNDQPDFEYFLQAGSFKQEPDAESRRAELALLGFESAVQKVVHNGSDWHRVQIGPIASRSRLSSVRGTLLENGVETIVLKRVIQ